MKSYFCALPSFLNSFFLVLKKVQCLDCWIFTETSTNVKTWRNDIIKKSVTFIHLYVTTDYCYKKSAAECFQVPSRPSHPLVVTSSIPLVFTISCIIFIFIYFCFFFCHTICIPVCVSDAYFKRMKCIQTYLSTNYDYKM